MDEARQPPQVLVVEDDAHVAAVQLDHLQKAGLRTRHLERGDAVEAQVRAAPPDLVLLDLMLPGMDGTEVCRALRAFSAVPIIMVTARVEEIDRLLGFDLGADDYLCKPFSPKELVARVQALLRRHGRMPPLAAAPRVFELDEAAQRVMYRGRRLELTPQEYRLLAVMATQPGRVFSRPQLLRLAYDDSAEVFDRAVDSHVKNLRRKLASRAPDHSFIHSVYGVGYRFEIVAGTDACPSAERRGQVPAPASERPVLVPADLQERLPGFLASRRALLDEMGHALAQGDADTVRRHAHRLAGSFALYGFAWAAQECLQLEGMANPQAAQVEPRLAALRRHLDRAEIRYVAVS